MLYALIKGIPNYVYLFYRVPTQMVLVLSEMHILSEICLKVIAEQM